MSNGDFPIMQLCNTAPQQWCGPCGNYLCSQYGCQRSATCQRTVTIQLSIAEQMGVDPISKLAAAIEKLAQALEKSHNIKE